ncbi:hypothetical protein CERSUDRAFT_88320 [Gelatoporia subvermispora B]|uniref:Uncharacterized protein n=1 Tax=Ceriporiopsis subvermispora (strain B) TaxID=914234 RepID=M2R256_CERS8|nr:hypothetical protein CERSUDRAFT_88320 [Gelatoporia subvermispora B]
MLPAAPKPGEQPVRRRRAGRKVKNAKMLAQQADLESRRKRHGAAWHGELHPAGDAAPVALDGLHESWRAPRVVAVHA